MIHYIEETDSTNREIKTRILQGSCVENLSCVVARRQTKGRGQKGNTWFSSEGESLTFSFRLEAKTVALERQFLISQFVALGLYYAVASLLPETKRQNLSIKWANDLYYQDRKLAGILIEHQLIGKTIAYSIVGIGLNVNHLTFPSVLPNPISLRQICPSDNDGLGAYELDHVLKLIIQSYFEHLSLLETSEFALIKQAYLSKLYRREGWHLYEAQKGVFMAKFREIKDNGELVLEEEDGSVKQYDIKDVQFRHSLS